MMAGCSHQHVQHKHPAEEKLSVHVKENKHQHISLSEAFTKNLFDSDSKTAYYLEVLHRLIKEREAETGSVGSRMDEHEEAIEKLIGRLMELEGRPQKLIELDEKPKPKKKR